jgi:hypothetical protein
MLSPNLISIESQGETIDISVSFLIGGVFAPPVGSSTFAMFVGGGTVVCGGVPPLTPPPLLGLKLPPEVEPGGCKKPPIYMPPKLPQGKLPQTL